MPFEVKIKCVFSKTNMKMNIKIKIGVGSRILTLYRQETKHVVKYHRFKTTKTSKGIPVNLSFRLSCKISSDSQNLNN